MPGEGVPGKFDRLNWETRVVLGLLWMGYEDQGDMCDLLAVTEPWLVEALRVFTADLLSSPKPVIQAALRHGLPGDCTAELPMPQTVRCRRCGTRVNSVPCVRCASRLCATQMGRKAPERVAEERTVSPPGSVAKIEAMRERVTRGESPFHPDDAMLNELCDSLSQIDTPPTLTELP